MKAKNILIKIGIVAFIVLFAIITISVLSGTRPDIIPNNTSEVSLSEISYTDVEYMYPAYVGKPSTVVNGNVPYFTDEEKKLTEPFETYSELDELGRCGVAFANICIEIMPTEPRGNIGSVKPSGWNYAKYDIVSGKYLYNRCHLIGFQLAGENANKKNLITGTRYLNIDGMVSYENAVADAVKDKNIHVLYRVTPYFIEDELVCRGLLIEAYSVEDGGKSIQFCVFCHNVQPGVVINYADGSSHLENE